MDFKKCFGLDYLKLSPIPTRAPSNASPRASGSMPSPFDPNLPLGLNDAVVAYSGRVIEARYRSQGQTIQLFAIAKELTAQVEGALFTQRLTRPISEISNDKSRRLLMTASPWFGSLFMGVPE
jgi:hypothetical protein